MKSGSKPLPASMVKMELKSTWLYKYYQAALDGSEVVGHEMLTGLKRLIDDLEDERFYYHTSEAIKRIDFMENCIRLTKSPFYGKPMKLMLWQKAFIETIYSYKMAADNTDRFRRVILLIARKNTKSETCSALGLTELILGAAGADLVCSSNDDNQADILYQAIDTMRLMIDPKQRYTWKNQKNIRNKIIDSKVFKLSDRTRNKEGRNIDWAVIDEAHEMKDNVIVKSIEQSQSLKPNPKLIIITTEGFVNEGFLDNELKRARKILNGEDDTSAADRVLPWLYTQDSEQEVWTNPESWRKSNPTLGIVKRWDYLQEQVDVAQKSMPDRMFMLAKDFNIKVNNSASWLMREHLENLGQYDFEEFRGAVCMGGVDIAETTDLCSAKCLFMKLGDKKKYIKSMYWIPESKLELSDDKEAGAKYAEWAKQSLIRIVEGNEVNAAIIADWFAELYKDYDIKTYKVGYDQRYAKDFINRMEDYGFETEMIYQNRFILTSPMRLVEADLRQGLINMNSNPVDRWCLENTSVQLWDTGHIMPIKIKGQSGKKIDGSLSLIMAYEMYRRYRTEFDATLR